MFRLGDAISIFGAKCAGSVRKFTLPACARKDQGFPQRNGYGIRAVHPWLRQSATVLPYFVRIQITNVCLPFLDKFHGIFVKLFKIVRSVKLPVFPIKSEPSDISLLRFHIFNTFLSRIGIIKSQIAKPTEIFRNYRNQCR